MENLTLLESEALEALKQLERCCDSADLHFPKEVKKNKFLEVTFGDMDFSFIKKPENLFDVEKFLQKNGLDFHITFDITNDAPETYTDDNHPSVDSVTFGKINGKDTKTIKKTIRRIISKLSYKKSKSIEKEITISYNIKIGRFIFNSKDTVEVAGKQKDVSDYLFEAGKDKKVSWDEINEKINDISNENPQDQKAITLIKKSINGAVTEINKKTEKYLEPQKQLIDFKDNEYWFQYKIGRDG